MTKIKDYLGKLNTSALPEKAVAYMHSDIFPDADIDLLDDNDEDVLVIISHIESEFPLAIPKEVVAPVEVVVEPVKVFVPTTPDEKEWFDAVDTLENVLIASGGSKDEIEEWKGAVDTLTKLMNNDF